jgi:hypothetical protein
MSGWIIKCKMPNGERGYIADDYGKGKDWTMDDLTFTSDARAAYVFPTLDAAKRVKDKLHNGLEAEIIDLDKPARQA